ncbi:unnamed protein product [Brassica oleracea]
MMMISDLPNDLEAEILSRVPAKSLSRLKTTCKRWYALFREPKFVVKNKKLGRAVRKSVLLTNHGDVCLVGDLHDTVVNTPIEVSGKLTSLKGSKDFDFAEIFHCEGLMLCSALGNDRLVVWNPCTGQTRNIKARTSFQTNQTYALGYSTSSSSGHSYKILRCFDYRNDQEVWVPQCEIYELSSDSWRVLDSFPLDYIMFRDGMSLKGNTYWVAGHYERMKKLSVLLIDDSSDYLSYHRSEAMRIWLSNKISEDANKDLLVLDEKLSVLHIDGRSNVMRIWVSNKVVDEEDLSWTSHCFLEGTRRAMWQFVLIQTMWKMNIIRESTLLVRICLNKFITIL